MSTDISGCHVSMSQERMAVLEQHNAYLIARVAVLTAERDRLREALGDVIKWHDDGMPKTAIYAARKALALEQTDDS